MKGDNVVLSTQRNFDYRAHTTKPQSDKSPAGQRIREILQDKGFLRALPGNSNGNGLKGSNGNLHVLPERSDSAKPTSVLVADDHPMVREGLVAMIDRQSDMHVLAQAGDGREAVEKYFTEPPDVALVDLRMPIMGGVETITTICEREPSARLVIVTTYQNEEDIYRALRAGARGYVLKSSAQEELVECIHAVGTGKTWIPPDVGAMLAKRVAGQDLTPREGQVLRAVASGKSNKEIGVVFNISEATVKVHVTHILEKLKVTGRTEAINVAVKRGLVRIEERACLESVFAD